MITRSELSALDGESLVMRLICVGFDLMILFLNL